MNFEASDTQFAEKVRESFARQPLMNLIGAELLKVEAGKVEIWLPFREDLTQQNGFLHAGITSTIVDSACGYAAYTLMPPETSVLTTEFKINFLAPAKGDYFLAEGRVLKPGKTLSVVQGSVYATTGDEQKLIAAMLSTAICVLPKG